MKKKLALAYVVALHLALAALVVKDHVPQRIAVRVGLRPAPEDPFVAQLRASQAERLDPAIPAGAVLFLGDSNTMSMPVSEVSAHAVNLGIDGQRSDQLLVSMAGYHSMERASAVVVMIGTDDVLHGREPRYREVLAAVPAGVPVVLVSAPPLRGHDMQPQAKATAAACATDPRCTFADAFPALQGKPDALRGDGVHLSPAGYAVLLPLLREALAHVHTTVTPRVA